MNTCVKHQIIEPKGNHIGSSIELCGKYYILLWHFYNVSSCFRTDLQIPELRECVHNDSKDNVQPDSCDEDEERHLINGDVSKVGECIHQRMSLKHL